MYLYIKKKGTVPKCGDCKTKLSGVREVCVLLFQIMFSFDSVESSCLIGHISRYLLLDLLS